MKTILRNYLATLRKHVPVTVLNLLGLSAAFIAFMVILMQVSFEFGYDKFRPASDRIYRVETKPTWEGAQYEGYVTSISRLNGETLIQSSPHIEEAGYLIDRYTDIKWTFEDQNGSLSKFTYGLALCSPELPSTIQLEMKEGSGRLDNPSQMLIPESMARKMFGDRGAMGQHIVIVDNGSKLTDSQDFYVSGVYKDIPANSILRNAFFVKLSNKEDRESLYVRLSSGRQKAEVEEAFNKVDLVFDSRIQLLDSHIRLQPLTAVYFANDYMHSTGLGNKRVTMLFLSIGLLILGIAMINYFNFAIAISPQRVRSINMQKILGSRLSALRGGMMLESMLFCLSAYGIALFGLYLLEGFSLINFRQAGITLTGDTSVLIGGGMIALGVGLLAGFYPAFYTTSIPAALSLKGSFGLSFKGRRMRTVLVGFQYMISITLLISAVFMNLQYRMMRNQDLGFNTDQVLMVRMTPTLSQRHTAFADLMGRNPAVQDVAFSGSPIVDPRGGSSRLLKDKDNETFELNWNEVSANYLSLMDFKIIEGRNFTPGDQKVDYKRVPVIINRKAQKAFEIQVGDVFENSYEVVGIIEDFNYKPFHSETNPFMFEAVNDNNPRLFGYDIAHLKINTDDYQSLISYITESAESMDPEYDREPIFLDQHIDSLYKSDNQNISRVTFFSILAFIISLSGVFSLISFEARFKRKEIGVRRVFGASVQEILALFNKTYLRVVIVCFVLAAPLAWYAMQQWLESYTLKIPMYWWVFTSVLLVVGLLTSLTVTWLSYRTATDNPVNALKVE